jgi:type IV pilus assembly protein PilW
MQRVRCEDLNKRSMRQTRRIVSFGSGSPFGAPCWSTHRSGLPAGAKGFSLIELMVAMTLGLIITAAVVAVFTSSRNTYQLDEGLARLQENARFAIDTITRETRQAASMGCVRGLTPFNNLNGAGTGGFAFDTKEMIRGFEASGTGLGSTRTYAGNFPSDVTGDWSPALDTNLVTQAMPGSDILVVRRISSSPVKLRDPYVDDNVVYLEAGAVNRFRQGDVVMVYDCQHASIFQVTNADPTGTDLEHTGSGTPGNGCVQWTPGPSPCFFDDQAYSALAEVAQVQTSVFYVSNTGRGIPALFQRVFPGGAGVELVEGVENMQVLYGIDDNGDGRVERYLDASQIAAGLDGADWGKVAAVRVALLASTVNTTGMSADRGVDTNTYQLLGSDAGTSTAVAIKPPEDNRRRRVFESTILARSRGF